MNIYESAEDYLERILMLRQKNGTVRSIDIARELDYSKPSVSVAMKRLRENGYLQMDPDGLITLLPPGEEIAQRIYARHQLLTEFLMQFGRVAAGGVLSVLPSALFVIFAQNYLIAGLSSGAVKE